MITERLTPLRVDGRTVHQVWLPYHWGSGGLVTGDSANDLLGISVDPNVLIQESKVGTCDVRPGRRPSGAALLELVADYQRRSGVYDDHTVPVVTAGAGAVDENSVEYVPGPDEEKS
jgi:formate dehydrogenase major subunit